MKYQQIEMSIIVKNIEKDKLSANQSLLLPKYLPTSIYWQIKIYMINFCGENNRFFKIIEIKNTY